MSPQELRKLIEQYDTITLYRHQHPDCDALGSQYSMKTWIEDNYPEKHVYALGAETTRQAEFPPSDVVTDETIAKSLAIVLDTSNTARVDDKRFLNAETIVKIDHHPDVETYGTYRMVNDNAAAACEILSEVFLSFPDAILSRKTAEYLYMGLLTDTLGFKVSHVTGKTLRIAAELADKGIDIPAINRQLFDKSYSEFETANYIRSRIMRNNGGNVACVILTMEELEALHTTPSEARNYIDEIGHVKEFDIWLLMTEKAPDVYDGSLRSKTLTINGIAAEFRGGGHACASGVKELSYKEILSLLDRLNQLASVN